MTGPSVLVVVRHGESLRNKVKGQHVFFPDEEAHRPLKGIPDHLIPLTPAGVEQARATGRHLKSTFGAFDVAYHSGYLRATETLDLLVEAYSPDERSRIPIRSSLFIRERDPGYAFEMTTAEAGSAFPWLEDHWRMTGGFFARPAGGENLAQVCERVHLFLNQLSLEAAGKSVLVVTHGGPIRCFRFLLENWSYQQAEEWPAGQEPSNCGVTVYATDPTRNALQLKQYNTVYWR